MRLNFYLKKTMRAALAISALMIMFCVEINAQNIKLSFRDATLKTVLRELTVQSGYSFAYSNALKADQVKITCNIDTNESISEVLRQLLQGKDISYTISGKRVVLAPVEIVQKQESAKKSVSGRITDENGEPLPGVLVRNEKSGAFVSSGLDGNYSIAAGEGDRLSFILLGMESYSITVGKNAVANIPMKTDVVALEDVVVTGYQTIERGRATGSYQVVNNKNLKLVVSNDVIDKLDGVVPGLVIDKNGEMMIRGQATIFADTKPLIVVDGFPMEYGTYNVNPNDIEQISVLKDAAAASIWGIRAANGVVVITTKKGTKNENVQVTYNANLKIGSKFDLASLGYLNSTQQVEWEREYFNNVNLINTTNIKSSGVISEAAWIEYKYKSGELSEQQRETEFSALASYNNTKDLQKYFYHNSLLQTHNIVLTGGSQTTTNYASINYEQSLGELKGNNLNKFGFQLNSTFEIAKGIKLFTGVRGNFNNKNTYLSSSINSIKPYVKIKDSEGNYVNEINNISQVYKDFLVSRGYVNWAYNRLDDRDKTENNTKAYNVAANVQLDIDLFKGLKFTTSGMYTVDHSANNVIYKSNSYYVRDLFNQFTNYNETTGELTNYLSEGGVKDIYNSNSQSYTFRNVLNYSGNSGKWSYSAMGGCEFFAIHTKTQSDRYYGYDPQGMTFNSTMDLYNLVSLGVYGVNTYKQRLTYNPSQTDAENRFFSVFFTGNVTYNDNYILFGSIRYDQTNLYGQSSEYRDQPTWSVGAKYIISNEDFFQSNVIDNLNIKASYGLSGNIDKTTSPYLIAANSRCRVSGLPTLTVQNPENPELCWEKVYTTNLGAELYLYKGRLSFVVDYYNRKTIDALGNAKIDPTTGWTSVKKNSASLLNRGLDLTLNGYPIKNQKFSWYSSLTFSYNYNKVTKVNAGATTLSNILYEDAIEGYPVDYMFEYKYAGVSADGKPLVYNSKGEKILFSTASVTFTPEDLVISGRKSPKYYGGWMNSFQFRGFTLDMMVTYKLGYKVRMPSIGMSYNTRMYKTFDQRWRQPGDEETTWVPQAYYNVQSMAYAQTVDCNEYQTKSGDIFRLRSLGLTYDFKRLIKSNIIQGLQVKAGVENLCWWAAAGDGIDPDRLYSNNSYTTTYLGKQPTYYTLSVNLQF